MPDPANTPDRVAALPARASDIDPAMVDGVLGAVVTTLRVDPSLGETAMLAQAEALWRSLTSARSEIAALKAEAITAGHIPSATAELDAIVAHTAAATDVILECCEQLDTLAPNLPDDATRIVHGVTARVYEACSFQDITGQRISKVAATLQAIELRVRHIVEAFGRDPFGSDSDKPGDDAPPPAHAFLLNGPQCAAAALDQATIDALLAGAGRGGAG